MSRPATHRALIGAQLAMDLRLTARRSENVLVTAIIPAALLVFFASVPVLALDDVAGGDPLGFLLAGALALAIIATSLVNLGIATAYERHYGVLKRLGGSPLGRGDLIVARLGAVLVVELLQVVVLLAIAVIVLGWRVPGEVSWPLLVGGLLLGTATFAGLGLLLAGTLRAEATLAVANGLFVRSCSSAASWCRSSSSRAARGARRALPAAALADAFRSSLPGTGATWFGRSSSWGSGRPPRSRSPSRRSAGSRSAARRGRMGTIRAGRSAIPCERGHRDRAAARRPWTSDG